jgi:hypothetical protein
MINRELLHEGKIGPMIVLTFNPQRYGMALFEVYQLNRRVRYGEKKS